MSIDHGGSLDTDTHNQDRAGGGSFGGGTDEGSFEGGTDEGKEGSNLDLSGVSLVGPDYDNPIFNESVEGTTLFPDYGEVG